MSKDKASPVIPSSRRMKSGYKRVYAPVSGESLTQQEFKDQCDINHQIALFTRAGRPLPAYGSQSLEDVQDLNATYIDAVNAVREVEDAFQLLPSAVRSRFNNSPLLLAEFLSDQANHKEAYDLGLVQAPPHIPSAPPSKKGPQGPSEPPKGGEAPSDEGAPN